MPIIISIYALCKEVDLCTMSYLLQQEMITVILLSEGTISHHRTFQVTGNDFSSSKLFPNVGTHSLPTGNRFQLNDIFYENSSGQTLG